MGSEGVGEPPPAPSEEEKAFLRLIKGMGKRKDALPPPKFVKRLESVPEIALPEEKSMRVAVSLAERGLIGQFSGLWPSPKTTEKWVQNSWRPLIKNGVTSYPVGKGFFLFEFSTKEDKDLIFRNGPYFMGPQGLYLNQWTPDFDPAVDIPKAVPVWVRLPNLPIHCWNPDSLQAIGNGLGRYIDSADPKGIYSCARICVEVDLEAGLPEAIKLTIKGWHHYQQLDYEQLPFKCRHCHEYGHFQRYCPKVQEIPKEKEKEVEEGWQPVKKPRAPRKKDPRNPNPPAAATKAPDPQKSGNSFAALEVIEIVPPAALPKDSGKSVPEPEGVREGEENSDQGGKETPPDQEDLEGETEEESSEEGNQDSKGKGKKGRRTNKEKREIATYADKLAGTQPTLPKILGHTATRNTRNQANASKGATINSKGQ